MRIVTWNMNGKDRPKQHLEAWAFLIEALKPDVALLQEVRISEDIEYEIAKGYSHLFAARLRNLTWGSAILSREHRLTLDWEDSSRGAALGATASIPRIGPVSIACLQAATQGGVIAPLRRKFDIVRAHLGERFIVGGDFNTARQAHLQWPNMGHGAFWSDIEEWGFHEPLPLDGRERQSYWGRWLLNELPTLGNTLQDDHVLLDAVTFRSVESCVVWDTRHTRELSDHGPVVVDVTLPG
jgi:endonuclease/exonuclease/phosphatase family metal-dependent hydrolase